MISDPDSLSPQKRGWDFVWGRYLEIFVPFHCCALWLWRLGRAHITCAGPVTWKDKISSITCAGDRNLHTRRQQHILLEAPPTHCKYILQMVSSKVPAHLLQALPASCVRSRLLLFFGFTGSLLRSFRFHFRLGSTGASQWRRLILIILGMLLASWSWSWWHQQRPWCSSGSSR